jgi:hypothetical protein
MAGLVFLFGFLGAGGRLQKARRGLFLLVILLLLWVTGVAHVRIPLPSCTALPAIAVPTPSPDLQGPSQLGTTVAHPCSACSMEASVPGGG